MSLVNMKKLLDGAQLPALPQSAISLLELSQDMSKGPSDFALPIEADPGLAGQVLRFVNSSYFGFAKEISSVRLAITLVGIRTIKNFALWSAVFSLMPNPKCGPFELKSLWQDSLRRALFARSMARLLNLKEAEEMFSAALLQDMAVPLLAKEISAAYVKLLEARGKAPVRLSTLERQVFGWSHAEAGAQMARQWSLPEEFAVLIESHADINRLVSQPQLPATKVVVAMSALLPASIDPAWQEYSWFETVYRKICPRGGPMIATLLEEIDREFLEFAPVLKVSTPRKSLVEYHQEAVGPTASDKSASGDKLGK